MKKIISIMMVLAMVLTLLTSQIVSVLTRLYFSKVIRMIFILTRLSQNLINSLWTPLTSL